VLFWNHCTLCAIVCGIFSVFTPSFCFASFLFQTQNGCTARDLAVQYNKAKVVALLDAHAVSGCVGGGEGGGQKEGRQATSLIHKTTNCFPLVDWFKIKPFHSFVAWQGGRAPGKR
jgi:hypothetical protein